MKAIVFNPYLDTLGGGDRYSLFTAISLAQLGYDTEIAWRDKNTLTQASDRFGFDLSFLKLNPQAYKLFSTGTNLLKRYNLTRRYQLIFWLSDASIPFLFASKNLIHIQTPFSSIGGNPLINKLKLLNITRFVYNSNFTRSILERHLPRSKGAVLYPPIDTTSFKPGKKENIILSVARFDSPSHSKRQDVLIMAFQDLIKKTNKKYTLILTGGLKGQLGKKIIQQLKTQANNSPIKIIANPNFTDLVKLYSQAKFFWHAAGYGIDEQSHPDLVEHFGMTTVEAMAAGCVPIVLGKGGQTEIITSQSGFTWQTIDELISQTLDLINNEKALAQYANSAILRAQQFSNARFTDNLKNIIKGS